MQMTVGDAIHLNRLHNILNSGLLHPADADMIENKLTEAEQAYELFDRFERPMSWEKPLERTIAGRKIREDEMADYKNQQVEEMIEQMDQQHLYEIVKRQSNPETRIAPDDEESKVT